MNNKMHKKPHQRNQINSLVYMFSVVPGKRWFFCFVHDLLVGVLFVQLWWWKHIKPYCSSFLFLCAWYMFTPQASNMLLNWKELQGEQFSLHPWLLKKTNGNIFFWLTNRILHSTVTCRPYFFQIVLPWRNQR